MSNLFGRFDFGLLDDPQFGEDSVREELIVPLLAALGYTASPPYRIIRSRKLEHPYVLFGTVRKGVYIIPDYLMERDGKYAWVLDAKGPREDIDTGKNVEQAYSYAMHREVRVPFYGLCNGHKLVVYHVSQGEPVIDVSLREIEQVWPTVLGVLGCKSAWPNGLRPDFLPDMGLALLRAGVAQDSKDKLNTFSRLLVITVSKIEDSLYSIHGIYDPEGSPFAVTFDFGPEEYQKLLTELSPELGERVKNALSRQPFRIEFKPSDGLRLTIAGEIGETTFTNNSESYRPFVAKSFKNYPSEIALPSESTTSFE